MISTLPNVDIYIYIYIFFFFKMLIFLLVCCWSPRGEPGACDRSVLLHVTLKKKDKKLG